MFCPTFVCMKGTDDQKTPRYNPVVYKTTTNFDLRSQTCHLINLCDIKGIIKVDLVDRYITTWQIYAKQSILNT